MVLVSLLELLHSSHRLYSLSLFDVQAIFTAIVSIHSELKASNPLITVKASRKLKPILSALGELGRNWSFARGLLQLFNKRGELTLSSGARDATLPEGQTCAVDGSENLASQRSIETSSTTTGSRSKEDNLLRFSNITPSQTAENSPVNRVGDINVSVGNFLDDFIFPDAFELEEFLLAKDGDAASF
jgi:hypothetical protein